jgi:outer membrane protein OmpA-like peptidoglycan-associated protein
MKQQILKTALAIGVVLFGYSAFSQEADAEGCKDHPFFNRLEKYYIYDCKKNYDEYVFMLGEDQPKTIEGNVTEITYSYDGEFGPKLPSRLQIIKNYENAIQKMGGTKIYTSIKDESEWIGGTFKLEKDGTAYWVGIYNLINNPVDQFSFILLEQDIMMQELEGNEMFDKIDSGEAVTLYVNFETGKSNIQSDSMSIIYDLFGMLKMNPELNIIIEGHTDDIGSKESNLALSESRAESIKSALVNKGVTANRILTKGYGSSKPIADNKSEEGRAKNRRVEVKKQG